MAGGPGMNIVAQRENGAYLLIETREDHGRVWDRFSNELYPEQHLDAILKFGYWQAYSGVESADTIVAKAQKPSFTNDPS